MVDCSIDCMVTGQVTDQMTGQVTEQVRDQVTGQLTGPLLFEFRQQKSRHERPRLVLLIHKVEYQNMKMIIKMSQVMILIALIKRSKQTWP